MARTRLNEAGLHRVRVATVANFPAGRAGAETAARETQRAVEVGADEVDVVFPWRTLLNGSPAAGEALVAACREACGDSVRLKVILESGMFDDHSMLRLACDAALRGGADFLKTSTGKAAVHATPPAAEVMLSRIAEHGGRCGFKASGGLRRLEDAAPYFDLADRILGPAWASPDRFRLGASSLLESIHESLGKNPNLSSSGRH
jgi:deoxyribose-phosphate aldolase